MKNAGDHGTALRVKMAGVPPHVAQVFARRQHYFLHLSSAVAYFLENSFFAVRKQTKLPPIGLCCGESPTRLWAEGRPKSDQALRPDFEVS